LSILQKALFLIESRLLLVVTLFIKLLSNNLQ